MRVFMTSDGPGARRKFWSRGRIILMLTILSACVMLFLNLYGLSLLRTSMDAEERVIMDKLRVVSQTAALLVGGDELGEYLTAADMEKESYRELRLRLRDFAEQMGVVFVYYLRREPDGRLRYIVDSDFDEETRVGLDTEPFDPSVDEGGALVALDGGGVGYMMFGEHREMWRDLVSAYAPVHDSKGRVVAAAGVDTRDAPIVAARVKVKKLNEVQLVSLMAVLITGALALVSFRRSAETADSANRSKSDFLARMSHEIRTPLNAIIGLTDLQLRNELAPDVRADLEKISSSGMGMLGLVNDILDLSKVEAGEFEIVADDFLVSSLVGEAAQLNLTRIGARRLDFSLRVDPDVPQVLRGDETRLRQVACNLLSNAVKYTRDGGVVVFEVCFERRGDEGTLVMEVADTGIGIREEDLGRLFGEYTRLNIKPGRQVEGTGLGLFITKNLVGKMGGTIEVQSVYKKGSVFKVRVPLPIVRHEPIGPQTAADLASFKHARRPGPRPAAAPRKDRARLRALVVDDIRVNLDIAQRLLARHVGCVDLAAGGAEAVAMHRRSEAEGRPYDIVFMDHMMPGMDGVEATRIIRESGGNRTRPLPVVAFTANAVTGAREMFVENGFDDFLTKPVDCADLEAVLEKWVPFRDESEDIEDLRRQAKMAAGLLGDLSPGDLEAAGALAGRLKETLARLGEEGLSKDAAFLEKAAAKGVFKAVHVNGEPFWDKLAEYVAALDGTAGPGGNGSDGGDGREAASVPDGPGPDGPGPAGGSTPDERGAAELPREVPEDGPGG
jgi:signal transduction histidine kinase/AmiR/NasT family two-component response regulator